jgi:hypothetical protein
MTKILSKKQTADLWHHKIDGYESRIKGLRDLRKNGMITEEEYFDYLDRCADNFFYTIKEFKLVHKLTCIVFAVLFTSLQVMSNNIDLIRAGRMGRRGRRHEYEIVL